jgi:branched-chain amino acid transport system ATP-binding protein
MMQDTVLETRNLTIRFGGLTAVNNFNAVIPRGSIVGLI